MTSPVDVYGNAQTIHPERRSLDVYQNETQRQILGGYQTLGQRIGQRGYEAFALPTDQFMKTMLGRQRGAGLPGSWQQRPSVFGLQGKDRKVAFRSYGGFGERRNPYATGDIEGVFARKRSIIAATGSTAPVERNQLSRGALGTLRFPIAQTPFDAAKQQEVTKASEQQVQGDPLSKFLTSGTEVMHAQTKSEAWEHFRAGEFRPAIRSFETAAMLSETDGESRIGAIFGYVSIGSVRTAIVSLDSFYRDDPNLFGYSLSMTDKYGEPTLAQQIRLSVLSLAQSSDQPPEIIAMSVFVLWYLDSKDDALRAAKALAAIQGNQRFANWPMLMETAMKSSPATTP